MWKKICDKFSDHPKSNKMTYGDHFLFAAGFAVEFIVIGFMLLIHAVFPFWFKNDASEFAEYAHEVLNEH